MGPRLRPRLRTGPRGGQSAEGKSGLASTSTLASTFVLGRRGDMVWNALIIVTVLLPLAGLTIDIPRYILLRSRLQIAADAAAEAAALTVDELHFMATGEVQLDAAHYPGAAAESFQATVANLLNHGYEATLDNLTVDETADAVTATASGTIRLLFGISPAFRVHAQATSWYRMVKR
jgi:hypothetical protein